MHFLQLSDKVNAYCQTQLRLVKVSNAVALRVTGQLSTGQRVPALQLRPNYAPFELSFRSATHEMAKLRGQSCLDATHTSFLSASRLKQKKVVIRDAQVNGHKLPWADAWCFCRCCCRGLQSVCGKHVKIPVPVLENTHALTHTHTLSVRLANCKQRVISY